MDGEREGGREGGRERERQRERQRQREREMVIGLAAAVLSFKGAVFVNTNKLI